MLLGASYGELSAKPMMSNGPPYLLAIAFGLLVSGVLYLVLVWPVVQPEDEPIDPSAAADDPRVPGPKARSTSEAGSTGGDALG